MGVIGAPNNYQPIDFVAVKVADQSELPAAQQEMIKDGYLPLPMAFGRVESTVALAPTFYVVGWKIHDAEPPKVML